MLELCHDIVLSQLERGAVLVDKENGRYLSLNESGLRILKYLREYGSVEEVADIVAKQTSADRSVIIRDIEKFCASLQDLEVVESR